jgi:hypothetical protein
MSITDVEVDTSDLAMLDDAHFHALCDGCYPLDTDPPTIVTAWCGKRWTTMRMAEGRGDPYKPPANACHDCLTLPSCATCGRPAVTYIIGE